MNDSVYSNEVPEPESRPEAHQLVFRWQGNQGRQATGIVPVAYSCSPEQAEELREDLGSLLRVQGGERRQNLVRTFSRHGEAVLMQRWPSFDPGGRPSDNCHVLVADPQVLGMLDSVLLTDWWCGEDFAAEQAGPLPRVALDRLADFRWRKLESYLPHLDRAKVQLCAVTAEWLRSPGQRVSLLVEELPSWPEQNIAPLLLLGLYQIFGETWLGHDWSFASYDISDNHPLRLMLVSDWQPGTGQSGTLTRIRQNEPVGDLAQFCAVELVHRMLADRGRSGGAPELVRQLPDGARLPVKERLKALEGILDPSGPNRTGRTARSVPRVAEPPRAEPPRAEPPRSEPPRAEPPRSEPPRTESPRSESPLPGPPSWGPPPSESPRPVGQELPFAAGSFDQSRLDRPDRHRSDSYREYESHRGYETPTSHEVHEADEARESRAPQRQVGGRRNPDLRAQLAELDRNSTSSTRDRLDQQIRQLDDVQLVEELWHAEPNPTAVFMLLRELGREHRRADRNPGIALDLCEWLLERHYCEVPPLQPGDNAGQARSRADWAAKVFSWFVAPMARQLPDTRRLSELLVLTCRHPDPDQLHFLREVLLTTERGAAPELPQSVWREVVRALLPADPARPPMPEASPGRFPEPRIPQTASVPDTTEVPAVVPGRSEPGRSEPAPPPVPPPPDGHRPTHEARQVGEELPKQYGNRRANGAGTFALIAASILLLIVTIAIMTAH